MTNPIKRALGETKGHDGQPCRIHTVSFEDPVDTLNAAKQLHAEGYVIADVHSPFPVHGIEDALDWPETRLGYVTLAGGLLGLTIAFGLQAYTHGVSWPLNIGGKTFLAIPAMGPVLFELMVLIAAYLSVFVFLYRRRLRPRFDIKAAIGQPHIRVNDDRFVILVVEQDGSFSRTHFLKLCKELNPVEIEESWRILS
jgi:hypothetical protein